MKWYILAVFAAAYSALKIGEAVARPDATELFFECTDDMEAHGVSALEATYFCKGLLNE
jgi:hypothetical protein